MPNLSILEKHSVWTLFSSGLYIILQAIQIVVITHFISKESFGFLSISFAFVFLCIALLETGVSLSIVQAQKINDAQIKAILEYNLKFAVGLSIALIPIAYLLKAFYQEDSILEITLYMIPVVLLAAYNSIFISRMKRLLAFKQLAIIEVISYLIAFMVVIILAMDGMEFMAIVYGYWARHFVFFFLLKLGSQTNLQVQPNDISIINQQKSFGKYIYGEKILTAIISNADSLIIGKMIGMNDLGVYDVFKRVVLRPLILFYNAIESVAFSLLSKLQNEKEAFSTFSQEFTNKINSISAVLIALLYINAESIILLFPESYSSYLQSFKLFTLLITSIILLNPLDLILYAQAKTRMFLIWISSYCIPFLIVLSIGSSFGLNCLIISYSAFNFVLFLLAIPIIISRESPIRAIDYLKTSLLPFLIPTLIIVVGFLLSDIVPMALLLQLLLNISLVIVLFIYYRKWAIEKNDYFLEE